MAKCDYCGSTIIMEPRRYDALQFCSDHCLRSHAPSAVASSPVAPSPMAPKSQSDFAEKEAMAAQIAGNEPATRLSYAQIEQVAWAVHQGNCPACGGPGPVDIHISHRVMSALVFTRWSSHPLVASRSCGVKHQIEGLLISLFLGWWGFPFGLILTPIQIGRNLFALCRGPDPSKPSSQLMQVVLAQIDGD